MRTYVYRRLLLVPITVLLLSMFVFGLVRAVPGDVVASKLENSYSQDQADELLAHFGLDKPLVEQYAIWLGQIFTGDLGRSFVTSRPILDDIKVRLPVTIELLVLTLIFMVPLGVALGVVASLRQDRREDYAVRIFSILLLAIPSFWLATLVIILPSLLANWSLPVGYSKLWENPDRNLFQVSVPAAVLGVSSAAIVMRVTRSQMLEVLRQEYIQTARAKGLDVRWIVIRHALPNTLIPLVTVIGLTVGFLIGGSVIIEQVFSLPGLGSYLFNALTARDLPVIQAVVLLTGTAFVLVNVVVDLSYAWLDPRIRLQ